MHPQPRHHSPRSDRLSLGPQLAKIAQAKRRPLMPWQARAADVALELDPVTGLPWYGIIVVTVPRQSGKTKLIGDVADFRALTVPEARIWYTAQTGKDASAWMRDEHFPSLARARLFGSPSSSSCRYKISKRAGQEGVDWKHGSTFRVFPPLRDALHGRQSDLVFVDEAWSLSHEQGSDVRQAIRPTMATRPGSQLWIVSTMGDDSSTFFDGYVDLALAGLNDPNSRVALIDYGIDEGDDPEDLELLASKHPAYGHTITLDTIRDARNDFGSDISGFIRAYGNRASRTRRAAFPDALWTAAARPRPDIPDRFGLGFDVTPDGTQAAIVAAWRDTTGQGWLEVLHTGRPGPDTARILAALHRRHHTAPTVDRASTGALTVLDSLDDRTPVTWLTMAEYASACARFERGILDGTLHHPNAPDLNAAAQVAVKRNLGDGAFGWGRAGSAGSIATLVAASVALLAYDRLPAPPRRPVAVARR